MSTLHETVRSVGATRVLEIGTGDGAAALEIASALPAEGMLISMEPDPAIAAAARKRFKRIERAYRPASTLQRAKRLAWSLAGRSLSDRPSIVSVS